MRRSSITAAITGAALTLLSISPTLAARADDPPSAQQNAAGQPKPPTEPAAKSRDDAPSRPSDASASATSANGPHTQAGLAAMLLGNLTPEHMKSVGLMLEQDWKNRPEWGDMAVAILKGENMRLGMGWWRPGAVRYDWNWLRGHFDGDSSGKVERSELPEALAKAELLFDRLDRDTDGQITAADLDAAGPPGMSMAAMQNMLTEYLFYRLDKDSNGRVTTDELFEFFIYADRDRLKFLTPEDLRTALDDPDSRKPVARSQQGPPSQAEMLRMFLTGQLGVLEAGPALGDKAPDFTLPTHDGNATVTLADSFGKRPVVLIFGSFT